MGLLHWLSRHVERRAKKAKEYARLGKKHTDESTKNFEWARNYHPTHPTHKVFVDAGNRNAKLARIYIELARRYTKP